VRTHVAAGTRAGLTARVMAAASLAGLLAVAASGFGATALAADSLSLTTPYPAVVVAPGSKVSFDLSVKTSSPDRVDLSVADVPSGWTATLHGGGFIVDAVQTDGKTAASASLDVSVPATASGTTHLVVTGTGGGQTVSLGLDIRVAADTGSVTLESDTPSLKGSSSTTFTFNLTLDNNTSQDLTFVVNATGPDGWTTTAQLGDQSQAASAVVKAGSSSPVTITAKPADGTAANAYPIHVVAAAGSQQASQDLQVEVTGSYSLSMSTPDQVLSTSGNAGSVTEQQLTITNSGTAAVTNVTMSDTAPTNWTVSFDQANVASIPANQSVTVTAKITPSTDAIAGDYSITFNANGDQASSNEDIRFTVQTSLEWALGGGALIVLVFVGLWWVFRRYGRR